MKNKAISINALDGHKLSGYLAHPQGTPKGGVIVLQEIFGVTSHIRQVTDSFAEHWAIWPLPPPFSTGWNPASSWNTQPSRPASD